MWQRVGGLVEQVSTFTQEVMAEEEDDFGSDIELAAARLKELQQLLREQTEQNQRLTAQLAEQTERADNVEQQMNKVSKEYARLLSERDEELATTQEQVIHLRNLVAEQGLKILANDGSSHGSGTGTPPDHVADHEGDYHASNGPARLHDHTSEDSDNDRARVLELENEVQSLRDELEGLQRSHNDALTRAEYAESQIGRLTAELRQQQQRANDAASILRTELDQEHKRNQGLEHTLRAMAAKSAQEQRTAPVQPDDAAVVRPQLSPRLHDAACQTETLPVQKSVESKASNAAKAASSNDVAVQVEMEESESRVVASAEHMQLLNQHNKAKAQLGALQEHLLELEAKYTQEALDQDTEIQTLRSTVQRMQQASQAATLLETKCARLEAERARLNQKLELQSEMLKSLQSNADNLEAVLADFEQEKRDAIGAVEEKAKSAQAALRAELQANDEELRVAKAQLEQQAGDIKALRQQLSSHNVDKGTVAALNQQVVKLRYQLNQTHAELSKALSSADERLVDKSIVRSAVVTYLSTRDRELKHEVLELLARTCDFSEQDEAKVGLRSKAGGIFSSLWGLGSLGSTPRQGSDEPKTSFGEEFVRFLLKESQQATAQQRQRVAKVGTAPPQSAAETRGQESVPAASTNGAPFHAASPPDRASPGSTRQQQASSSPALPVSAKRSSAQSSEHGPVMHIKPIELSDLVAPASNPPLLPPSTPR